MEIHTDHVARIIARANTVTERVQQRRGSKTRWIPEIAITPRRQGNFEGFEKMLKLLEIDIYRGEGRKGGGPSFASALQRLQNRALALLLNLTDYCTSKFSALCRLSREGCRITPIQGGADIFIGSDRERSPRV